MKRGDCVERAPRRPRLCPAESSGAGSTARTPPCQQARMADGVRPSGNPAPNRRSPQGVLDNALPEEGMQKRRATINEVFSVLQDLGRHLQIGSRIDVASTGRQDIDDAATHNLSIVVAPLDRLFRDAGRLSVTADRIEEMLVLVPRAGRPEGWHRRRRTGCSASRAHPECRCVLPTLRRRTRNSVTASSLIDRHHCLTLQSSAYRDTGQLIQEWSKLLPRWRRIKSSM